MTKVFISQPMKDKTNQKIEEERKAAVRILEKHFGEIEVIDSFFKDAPHEAKPLWFLGKSLQLLSNADLVVFTPGWETARGCRIEHEAAMQYGFKIIYIKCF